MSAPAKPAASGVVTQLALVLGNTTRSDAACYFALAHGLRASGFRLRLVAPEYLREYAASMGLADDYVGLEGNPEALAQSDSFKQAVSAAALLALAKLVGNNLKANTLFNMSTIHRALTGMDGVLCTASVLTECSAVAQKYQIPLIAVPSLPLEKLPLATFVPKSFSASWLNELTHDLGGFIVWSIMGGHYNKFRTEELHIGPQAGYVTAGVAQVTAFSGLVVPPTKEWGANVHTSGLWKLPDASPLLGVPSAASSPLLHRLLASPSVDPTLRPIFVSFEHHPLPQPAAFVRMCHAVASRVGVPVILQSHAEDWPTLSEVARSSPELDGLHAEGAAGAAAVAAADVKLLLLPPRTGAPLPYQWLLPRCSLAVHSGGGYITQAAIETGIPSAAFPAFGEEYYWASRISSLNCGPLVYYPLRDAAERIEEVVKVCRTPAVAACARRLGEAVRAEGDGVGLAVRRIRDILSKPQHRHCGISCTWVPDSSSPSCSVCKTEFTMLFRRRHCRSCGRLACGKCLSFRAHLPGYPETAPQIVCETCLDGRRSFLAVRHGKPVVPGGAAADASAAASGGSAAVPVAAAASSDGVGAAGAGVASSPARSGLAATAATSASTPGGSGAVVAPARGAIMSDVMDDVPLADRRPSRADRVPGVFGSPPSGSSGFMASPPATPGRKVSSALGGEGTA